MSVSARSFFPEYKALAWKSWGFAYKYGKFFDGKKLFFLSRERFFVLCWRLFRLLLASFSSYIGTFFFLFELFSLPYWIVCAHACTRACARSYLYYACVFVWMVKAFRYSKKRKEDICFCSSSFTVRKNGMLKSFFYNFLTIKKTLSGTSFRQVGKKGKKEWRRTPKKSKFSPKTASKPLIINFFFKKKVIFFLQKEKSTIFAAKICPDYARTYSARKRFNVLSYGKWTNNNK